VNVAKEKRLGDREEEFVDKTDSSEEFASLRGGMERKVVEDAGKEFGGKGGEGSGRRGRPI